MLCWGSVHTLGGSRLATLGAAGRLRCIGSVLLCRRLGLILLLLLFLLVLCGGNDASYIPAMSRLVSKVAAGYDEHIDASKVDCPQSYGSQTQHVHMLDGSKVPLRQTARCFRVSRATKAAVGRPLHNMV